MRWLYLGAAILSEVSGSLALRAALDHPAWYAWVAIGYVASFVLLALVLRLGTPVGVAYGIWAACGVAITAVAAAFLFDDPLNWTMGAGFAAIIGGVLLIEMGSHPPTNHEPTPAVPAPDPPASSAAAQPASRGPAQPAPSAPAAPAPFIPAARTPADEDSPTPATGDPT